MIKQVLSCDWGTSSFRLRLIDSADGPALAETTGGKGIADVYNEWLQSGRPENERVDFYKNILLSELKKLNGSSLSGLPVIISGMASSSIGIKELAYGDIPFSIDDSNLNVHSIEPDEKYSHEILIVSGLKTTDDVMRGEETMLVGCDIGDNNEQLVIFPGTHSKHGTIKNKVLVDFKTYMTGEVFDLLSNKSILSKSIMRNENTQYRKIFERGVKEGAENNLLNAVFHIRANGLFKSLTPEENYHYLSGLLIGHELQQISHSKIKILLVCSGLLYNNYWHALQILCGNTRLLQYFDADKALIRGHYRLAKRFL